MSVNDESDQAKLETSSLCCSKLHSFSQVLFSSTVTQWKSGYIHIQVEQEADKREGVLATFKIGGAAKDWNVSLLVVITGDRS